ncbi:MAG: DUF4401 domain-containing protein [Desulfovibrionaceae bacterium]|nr:DUF4401 domain-containing protein [Desulfovibrionaceae bacterium]
MEGKNAAGLRLIPGYVRLPSWLDGLFLRGNISPEAHAGAARAFGLRPGPEVWKLFMESFFALMGTLLILCGLIFLLAWNWENLSRQGKFVIAEVLFAICGLWACLRWIAASPASPPQIPSKIPYDARLALLAGGLLGGALLALYGQIYQTGGDPWELFRAWSLLLIFLVLAAREALLLVPLWIVASLWASLYFLEAHPDFPPLEISLVQFFFLILAELLHRFTSLNPRRVLCRLIGGAAFILLTAQMILLMQMGDYYRRPIAVFLSPDWGLSLYFVGLGVALFFYYRPRPDLFLLACPILSAAVYLLAWIILNIDNWFAGSLLLNGLLIMGLGLGVSKLVLHLRKLLRERARLKTGVAEAFFKAEEEERLALSRWLLEKEALPQAELEDFFREDVARLGRREPWISKIFTSLSAWAGSLLLFGFLVLILADLFPQRQFIGLLGLAFCAASVPLERKESLASRQFSRVAALCGLAMSCFLTDFHEQSSLVLLAALFACLWISRRHLADKSAAAIGLLVCLGLFLAWHVPRDTGYYLYNFSLALGLLFGLYQHGLPLQPSGRIQDLRRSAALACLVFFSFMLLAVSIIGAIGEWWLSWFYLYPHALSLPLVLLACLAAIWRGRASLRPLVLAGGLVFMAAAYFTPACGLGMALLFLTRAAGKDALSGLATFYLSLDLFFYYYNLDILLRDKALLLLLCGSVLLLAVLLLRRLVRIGEIHV